MINFLQKRFSSLAASESGNVIIMFCLSLLFLITAVGAAVDMAREQTLETRLQNALDAAGLAAGATANSPPATLPGYCTTMNQTTWVGCQAQRYFEANFPVNYLESGAGAGAYPTVQATLNTANQTVSLSASTPQQTTFLSVAGITQVTVGANTTVTLAGSQGMELALVLDNTGSMNNPPPTSTYKGETKLTDLKQALLGGSGTTIGDGTSSGLIYTLYGTGTAPSNLFIGVVPFANFVNIGTSATSKSWLTGGTGAAPTGWTGCVLARSTYTASTLDSTTFPGTPNSATAQYTPPEPINGQHVGGLDISEDPPASASFPVALHPLTANVGLYEWDEITPQGTTPTGDTGGSLPVTQYATYDGSGNQISFGQVTNGSGTPVVDCTKPLLPLTATKSTVVGEINSLTAGGSTFLDLGLAWGWRVLSPQWSGVWSGLPTYNGGQSLPLPYNTANMQKVVVFMTDGMNDWSCPNNSTTGSPAGGQGLAWDYYVPNSDYTSATRACGEYGDYGVVSDFKLMPQTGYFGTYTFASWPASPIPPYTYDDQPWLNGIGGNPTSGAQYYALTAERQLDALTVNVCNAMKAKGIIIYTIGFGTPLTSGSTYIEPTSESQRSSRNYLDVPLLQACSSTPNVTCNTAGSNCYFASSNADIDSVFKTIGTQLTNLRVSQ